MNNSLVKSMYTKNFGVLFCTFCLFVIGKSFSSRKSQLSITMQNANNDTAKVLTDLHSGVTGVTYIPECSLKIYATSGISKGII